MAFGKSKTPSPTPLQRLNDRRRSLVLAGLATGAAVAAIFRRRKSGGGAEFGEPTPVAPQPEPVVAPSPVDSGPPAAVDVPAPADGAADMSAPAADVPDQADGPGKAEAPVAADESSAAKVEPATGELSAEEASILAVLAQSGRVDDDRTAIAVATSLERETADVAGVLRKLAAEGVVSGELYTAAGDKIWAVTERGVRRLGAQS